MAKQFLSTASSEFLELQTGKAQPLFYIEAIISGVTSVLGDSYTSTNWIIDGGTIDREKPVFPGDRSNIFASDVTIKLDNSTKRFSPKVTGSEFFGNEYINSRVNYYGGFVNTSGTGLFLQRGQFLLDNIKLDSRNNYAFLRLRDKFKKTLETQIGIGTDTSGTAIQFVITGIQDGASAIQSLLITGAGLTAGDTSIVTAGQSFNNLSLSEQSVAEAVSLVAEASDGFIFTNRHGLLEFVSNAPVFGTAPTPDFTIRESNWAINTIWEQNSDDRVAKVEVEFRSGQEASVVSDNGNTATTIIVSNDAINDTGDAVAIASRIRDRFSGQVTRLEIPSIWAPSIDIGNIISVHATSLGLVSASFEVYKIQEEMTRGTMRLFLINEDRVTGKWAFFSHQTGAAAAGEHSAVFAGSGASQSGAWQAGWGFFAGETTGFDADGDVDGVMESGVTSSGAGGTGIEVAFQFY